MDEDVELAKKKEGVRNKYLSMNSWIELVEQKKSHNQENKVSKMFTLSLRIWIKLGSRLQSQAVPTVEYGLLNQPITVHIVPER